MAGVLTSIIIFQMDTPVYHLRSLIQSCDVFKINKWLPDKRLKPLRDVAESPAI